MAINFTDFVDFVPTCPEYQFLKIWFIALVESVARIDPFLQNVLMRFRGNLKNFIPQNFFAICTLI